jgi:SPP1 family predicted phage head-tail adaptor
MNWRDVINLIVTGPTTNNMGDAIDGVISTNQVFANKKSIRQSEFYQAMANGLRPEIMFEIRTSDYTVIEDALEVNETVTNITFNSQTYGIIRLYSKNDEFTEIICNRLTNNN